MDYETIDNKLANFIITKGVEPEVIIMHNNTYKQFVASIHEQFCLIDYNSILNPKYRGIKIYRTDDIKKDAIEIY